MSEPTTERLAPGEARAVEAVRALGRPVADAEFRERLARDFVAGAMAPRVRVVRFPLWAVLGPVAAAAAAIAIVLGLTNRAPDWRVTMSSGQGMVNVNGSAVPLTDLASLSARLRRGGHIVVPQGQIELVSPGQVAVSLAPGADIVLPPPPNRWFRRHAAAQIAMGDAFFMTGRGFHGASLDVSTPEATAHVVGTAFAVLCQPGGTCICVMEGHVRVGHRMHPDDVVTIPAGLRRMCYDDSPSETGPILMYSVHHLHHLQDVTGQLLGR